jgi:Family of unknown function (DUF6069)
VSSPTYQTEPGGSPPRPTVAAGTLWAGGAATGVVAALAYVVGIVVARVVFDVPVLAPEREGALGDSTTSQLALTAFGAALLATALMHLLLVVTPRPYSFFAWIMGLIVVLVTVLPFAWEAPVSSQVATAIINLVVGAMITSLVRGTAARAVRPARRPADPYGPPPGPRPGPGTSAYPYERPRPGTEGYPEQRPEPGPGPGPSGYPDQRPGDPYGRR